MAVRSGQITADSTAMSLSITGGSTITLVPVNSGPKNVELVVSTDTDSRTRRRFKVSTNDSKPAASMPSGYTMNKATVDILSPITLANGKVEYSKVSITKQTSVENTAAQITELRRLAAQVCLDSDFDDLWVLNSNQ